MTTKFENIYGSRYGYYYYPEYYRNWTWYTNFDTFYDNYKAYFNYDRDYAYKVWSNNGYYYNGWYGYGSDYVNAARKAIEKAIANVAKKPEVTPEEKLTQAKNAGIAAIIKYTTKNAIKSITEENFEKEGVDKVNEALATLKSFGDDLANATVNDIAKIEKAAQDLESALTGLKEKAQTPVTGEDSATTGSQGDSNTETTAEGAGSTGQTNNQGPDASAGSQTSDTETQPQG